MFLKLVLSLRRIMIVLYGAAQIFSLLKFIPRLYVNQFQKNVGRVFSERIFICCFRHRRMRNRNRQLRNRKSNLFKYCWKFFMRLQPWTHRKRCDLQW